MSEKKRYPADAAMLVAVQILGELQPYCERVEIAGSLRRLKETVGDIEIVYVPKFETERQTDLFGVPRNMVDWRVDGLMRQSFLVPRPNVKGNLALGEQIKLMRHIRSGIPVDLFATSKESWWNYLVCRTGGSVSNTRIASRAKEMGYKWKPYSAGFEDLSEPGKIFAVHSEQEVFKFVGLLYEEPSVRP